jgi:hypothetical protein
MAFHLADFGGELCCILQQLKNQQLFLRRFYSGNVNAEMISMSILIISAFYVFYTSRLTPRNFSRGVKAISFSCSLIYSHGT